MINTPSLELDHLVVVANSLEEGRAWISEQLGVTIPLGGRHDFMATHNAVMSLGADIYLEVIAIDPALPPPARQRWFGLDQPAVRSRLAQGPYLVHYLMRSSDIAATLGRLDSGLRAMIGAPMAASRDSLSWQITIAEDGRPAADGCLPGVIQWHSPLPQRRMHDAGLRLQQLVLHHPEPVMIGDKLHQLGAGAVLESGLISLEEAAQPRLGAWLEKDGVIASL